MSLTVHYKIKFSYDGKVVTITAETKAAIAALKMTPQEIPISPNFEVYIIYEDELDKRITSMIRKMNFIPGMGL